jgi:hypothetical protein
MESFRLYSVILLRHWLLGASMHFAARLIVILPTCTNRFSDLPALITQGLETIANVYRETAKVSCAGFCLEPTIDRVFCADNITDGYVFAEHGDVARVDAAGVVGIR